MEAATTLTSMASSNLKSPALPSLTQCITSIMSDGMLQTTNTVFEEEGREAYDSTPDMTRSTNSQLSSPEPRSRDLPSVNTQLSFSKDGCGGSTASVITLPRLPRVSSVRPPPPPPSQGRDRGGAALNPSAPRPPRSPGPNSLPPAATSTGYQSQPSGSPTAPAAPPAGPAAPPRGPDATSQCYVGKKRKGNNNSIGLLNMHPERAITYAWVSDEHKRQYEELGGFLSLSSQPFHNRSRRGAMANTDEKAAQGKPSSTPPRRGKEGNNSTTPLPQNLYFCKPVLPSLPKAAL
ncbi:hypothetical protein CSUB01_12582 [Colletotrichum sublineola]|uniref:Uncharacterized protein n=1 Tax=Colletotrichum sublineola TaxID=1173701 RepID=A0A066XQC8_COLSU|nr:hypothetical protein CSUB01_12582 [Colletotrichum sublineola]